MTIERPTRSGLYGTIYYKCPICLRINRVDTPQGNDSVVLWSVCTTCLSSGDPERQAIKLAFDAINGVARLLVGATEPDD